MILKQDPFEGCPGEVDLARCNGKVKGMAARAQGSMPSLIPTGGPRHGLRQAAGRDPSAVAGVLAGRQLPELRGMHLKAKIPADGGGGAEAAHSGVEPELVDAAGPGSVEAHGGDGLADVNPAGLLTRKQARHVSGLGVEIANNRGGTPQTNLVVDGGPNQRGGADDGVGRAEAWGKGSWRRQPRA